MILSISACFYYLDRGQPKRSLSSSLSFSQPFGPVLPACGLFSTSQGLSTTPSCIQLGLCVAQLHSRLNISSQSPISLPASSPFPFSPCFHPEWVDYCSMAQHLHPAPTFSFSASSLLQPLHVGQFWQPRSKPSSTH